MREYLNKLIAAKEKRANELREQIKTAETADEVRSLGKTLDAVLEELTDAKAQLEKLDENDDQAGNDQQQDQGDNSRGVNPMREFRAMGNYNQQRQQQPGDRFDTVEYRTAFMNYVCRNIPMPAEMRADAVTTTADAGAVIPTTYLNEIVRELRSYGEIYSRVRHLSVQGGVQIGVLDVKPTAKWITANTGASESEKQKIGANDKIVFNYYGLECKVAQSLLASVVTLEVFQEQFVQLAAEAMAQALEIAIFNGTGSGEPMGITKDSRVPAANVIIMSAADFASWSGWQKKVFAKMKKAYRNGSFIMAQGTFDGYINGMADQNGQPIGRVNYGITDGETYRFGGKEVLTVEEDVLAAYDSAEAGAVVAVFAKLSDYAINSNMQMQVVKWIDHDTNELKNKTILICDGKLVDPNGVLIIKKGS